MRVLLITEFFPTGKDLRFSGGVEARTYFVAKGLAKRHKVFVLASRTKGSKRQEKLDGFTVYRVGEKRDYTASTSHIFSRTAFIFEATKFGKQLDTDLIDGGNYIAHFIAKNISNAKKIPVVAWYPDVWLSNWLKNAGTFGIFGEILERINLIRGFDAYIAISKQTKNKLTKVINRKINLIYCGVQSKEFVGKSKKFSKPTIISVSRLAKYKNIRTILFAAALLAQKVNNIELILVGSGPELKKLKNLAKNLKISKKVKFLSNLPRKDLISLYKSSLIFTLPSLVEGFGIATIEAASAGLPYVNSDIPIQKEITKSGKGGYLVSSESAMDYAKKFERLIMDKKLYKIKSKNAIELAKSYNWDTIVKQTEKVYLQLVKEK